MRTLKRNLVLLFLNILIGWSIPEAIGAELVKGIYLTQSTLENTEYLNYLIQRSKTAGISTFIIDIEKPSKKYGKNIKLVKDNNIIYVARVVIFPGGGTPEQVASQDYWKKRFETIQHAINYGADQIQIDYIRYSSKQPASSENSKNVIKVVQWFKSQLSPYNLPLQADVFGIASFGEAKNIGQNVKLFGQTVDALCPMVYPSHYEPFKVHAVNPYKTIYDSLKGIHAQFDNKPLPFKLYPYIELSNYRYPLSAEKRLSYISEEIRAVKGASADGWYAWSAHNKYDRLFELLENEGNKVKE